MVNAKEVEADVLIISEQNRDRGDDCGWYPDANSRAAIAIMSDISVDKIGQALDGWR